MVAGESPPLVWAEPRATSFMSAQRNQANHTDPGNPVERVNARRNDLVPDPTLRAHPRQLIGGAIAGRPLHLAARSGTRGRKILVDFRYGQDAVDGAKLDDATVIVTLRERTVGSSLVQRKFDRRSRCPSQASAMAAEACRPAATTNETNQWGAGRSTEAWPCPQR